MRIIMPIKGYRKKAVASTNDNRQMQMFQPRNITIIPQKIDEIKGIDTDYLCLLLQTIFSYDFSYRSIDYLKVKMSKAFSIDEIESLLSYAYKIGMIKVRNKLDNTEVQITIDGIRILNDWWDCSFSKIKGIRDGKFPYPS